MTAISAGGTVTAGTEAYGFSISGDDANVSLVNDNPVTSGTILSSSSTAVTDVQAILTFSAAISSVSSANTYSQSITLSVSNNF